MAGEIELSKDRNTVAKRQRETDKRQKATEKREKRIQQRTNPVTDPKPDPNADLQLSDGEISVLTVFRKYLMTPGQMLCLSNSDADSMKIALEKLVTGGLLTPDDFKGGYSLTRNGYDKMAALR